MKLERIKYEQLNARQKENFNFHKVAAILADYGYNSMKLNDDWEGADFIAIHNNGEQIIKVQLKARISVDQKYLGKDIYIAVLLGQKSCFLYPHDELYNFIANRVGKPISTRHFPKMPQWMEPFLEPFKILDLSTKAV